MYPVVTQLTVADDYILRLCFDNGERGELDMSPYLDFGEFSRLKNKADFQQAKVAFDTIEWPCGVDLDPEFVYQKTVKAHS